jgi:cell wall-associated NlpC family hydrolase
VPRSFVRSGLLALLFAVVLSAPGAAQSSPRRSKKPFEAFSESARRLRDSLVARAEGAATVLGFESGVVVAASEIQAAALRDTLVATARSQLGTRYRLGAERPGKAFDCSGLVRFVASVLRLDLPRTAHLQARIGEQVATDPSVLRPGDLLTFGSARRVTHIGIYAGEGRVIHASTTAGRVIETQLEGLGQTLLGKWTGVRRLVAFADTATRAAELGSATAPR